MNRSLPQEPSKNVKDLYQSMPPKKRRTFSENMIRLRQPFLCSENGASEHSISKRNEVNTKIFKLRTPTLTGVKIKNNDGERKLLPLMNQGKSMETKISESATDIDKINCSEMSEISGYYSEGSTKNTHSFLESETSLENYISHEDIKPLTNSTFISQKETSENETYNSLNETKMGSEISVSTGDEVDTEPNKSMHYSAKGIIGDSKMLTTKYSLYQLHNLQTDSNNCEPKENELEKLKTLKVPANFGDTEYDENKDLQKKLLLIEHTKQIENKDKVMGQLLEISQSTDFPKLKHLCNINCEKDKNGVCKKIKQEMENNVEQQEEYNSLFHYIWSSVKHVFDTNPETLVKKEEGLEINIDEENDQKSNKEVVESVEINADKNKNIKEDKLENKKVLDEHKDSRHSNKNQDSDSLQWRNKEIDKKSKSNSRFLSFFQSTPKTKNVKGKAEEYLKDTRNKSLNNIESMEEKPEKLQNTKGNAKSKIKNCKQKSGESLKDWTIL